MYGLVFRVTLQEKNSYLTCHHYRYSSLIVLILFEILISFCGYSQKNTDLLRSNTSEGLSLLPGPQKISFSGRDFLLNDNWILEPGSNISMDSPAVQSLIDGLNERGNIKINSRIKDNNDQYQFIRLTVRSGSVSIPCTGDSSCSALMDQAYRLKLDASEISINANASAGLFYGFRPFFNY